MGETAGHSEMTGLALLLLGITVTVPASGQQDTWPPAQEDPWLQVLNGGGQQDQVLDGGGQLDQVLDSGGQQDLVLEEEQVQARQEQDLEYEQEVEFQQPPRRPPPQRFQQPVQRPQRPRPQQRPRPGQGPPRQGRPPVRPRPGRRPTTSAPGILDKIRDASNNALNGVVCSGSNILTDAKLKDEDFIKYQLDCARNIGPCDDIGEKIKILAPEVLAGRCPRPCNECTRSQIKRVMAELSQKFPREFQEMIQVLGRRPGRG